MRKSRKELEDLCNELQDSLRKKDEALNELKKDADQAAQKMLKEQEDSKEKLEEERLKVEKLAKTMQQKEQKAEEVIQELMSSRAQNIAASKEEVEEEEVEEEEVEEKVEIEQAKQDAKEEEEEIEYKIFYPFYEWKTLKKNEKAYRENECDVQGEAGSKENPKKVRIPTTWTLNLKLEGGNDGANSNVSMKVRKETTTRQVLEDAAAQLGMGPTFWQSLCLMYRHEDESGIHQANAGEKVDNTWTVEKANLFNRRPRLCKFTGISDEDINRLIEKLLAHKKSRKEQNEPDFDPDDFHVSVLVAMRWATASIPWVILMETVWMTCPQDHLGTAKTQSTRVNPTSSLQPICRQTEFEVSMKRHTTSSVRPRTIGVAWP